MLEIQEKFGDGVSIVTPSRVSNVFYIHGAKLRKQIMQSHSICTVFITI